MQANEEALMEERARLKKSMDVLRSRETGKPADPELSEKLKET